MTLSDYYGPRVQCLFPAGSRGLYSNDGFAVLGQLIEDVTGEPLENYMQREIFEPLGASSTSYVQPPADRSRMATAYEVVFGEVNEIPQRDIVLKAAGSVSSSLEDMARLGGMIIAGGRGDGGQVIAAATLASMIDKQAEAEGSVFRDRGLAFGLLDVNGHRAVCHNGGFPGFYSALAVAPDTGVGVVLLTNTSSGAPAALVQRLHEHTLARLSQSLPRVSAERCP